MEQVTDFASASDHTLSLEKMREMNIAISVPHPLSGQNEVLQGSRVRSVFEDDFDFTALDAEKLAAAGQKRWKYRGPWLANLTHGEFQDFLKKEVRGRRDEFRKVICEHLAQKQTQEAAQQAVAEGTIDDVREVRPEDITDEHITDFFRIARRNNDELYGLISKFLDLAPIEHDEYDWMGMMQPDQSKRVDSPDPYAKYGPPITHPSAGLSYLRTSAFLENHPVYGPQKMHAPVKARVLGVSEKVPHMAAVGGFVANHYGNLKNSVSADFQSPGGCKTWVQINTAQVDSKGKLLLGVRPAQGTERQIQEEMVGDKRLFRDSVDRPASKEAPIRSMRSSIRDKGGRLNIQFSGPGTYGT